MCVCVYFFIYIRFDRALRGVVNRVDDINLYPVYIRPENGLAELLPGRLVNSRNIFSTDLKKKKKLKIPDGRAHANTIIILIIIFYGHMPVRIIILPTTSPSGRSCCPVKNFIYFIRDVTRL